MHYAAQRLYVQLPTYRYVAGLILARCLSQVEYDFWFFSFLQPRSQRWDVDYAARGWLEYHFDMEGQEQEPAADIPDAGFHPKPLPNVNIGHRRNASENPRAVHLSMNR